MLRRQKYALSQSTTPLACTLDSGKIFQQFSRNFPGTFLQNSCTDPRNSHSLLEFSEKPPHIHHSPGEGAFCMTAFKIQERKLGGRSGYFIFFSGRGWGKGGDVRADGRGVGFYWKLEGGREGGGSEEVAGGVGRQALRACLRGGGAKYFFRAEMPAKKRAHKLKKNHRDTGRVPQGHPAGQTGPEGPKSKKIRDFDRD